jgi:putative SOS response-associated peptidase YedK
MCSNYQPPIPESLSTFGYPNPGFEYSECYPSSTAPFLTTLAPDRWLPGTFGLLPEWADPKLAKMTYNARTETVAERHSFRSAWRNRQLCVIPVQAFYEPNYESGKAVRWRIERTDGKPFGLAGIWESRSTDNGAPWWSFTMLTINADEHPLMHRFHKPGDEKRSVVVLPDDAWSAWLSAKQDENVRSYLQPFNPGQFRAEPDPVRKGKPTPSTQSLF